MDSSAFLIYIILIFLSFHTLYYIDMFLIHDNEEIYLNYFLEKKNKIESQTNCISKTLYDHRIFVYLLKSKD